MTKVPCYPATPATSEVREGTKASEELQALCQEQEAHVVDVGILQLGQGDRANDPIICHAQRTLEHHVGVVDAVVHRRVEHLIGDSLGPLLHAHLHPPVGEVDHLRLVERQVLYVLVRVGHCTDAVLRAAKAAPANYPGRPVAPVLVVLLEIPFMPYHTVEDGLIPGIHFSHPALVPQITIPTTIAPTIHSSLPSTVLPTSM